MSEVNIEDLTFQLLANPSRLKKKEKKKIINEDDIFFKRVKKRYPDMLIFNSDKNEILEKIETILTEITISNIVENLVREIEYELLP
jgi:isopentenyl phosphate kinase